MTISSTVWSLSWCPKLTKSYIHTICHLLSIPVYGYPYTGFTFLQVKTVPNGVKLCLSGRYEDKAAVVEKIFSQLVYYKNKGVSAPIPIAMVIPWEIQLDMQDSTCFLFGSCNTTLQTASYRPTPIFQKWPRTCSQFCRRSLTDCEHVIGRCLLPWPNSNYRGRVSGFVLYTIAPSFIPWC